MSYVPILLLQQCLKGGVRSDSMKQLSFPACALPPQAPVGRVMFWFLWIDASYYLRVTQKSRF